MANINFRNPISIKASKYFYMHEIVPKNILFARKEKCFELFPEWYFDAIDGYREYFGVSVYANNWYWGGNRDERGYRHPRTVTGADLSQHKLGKAFDNNVKGLSSTVVQSIILKDQSAFLQMGWTTIEDVKFTPTWNHLDGRNNKIHLPQYANKIRLITP